MGKQPHPWSWIAAADYAGMVSAALRKPEAAGKKLVVHGPERVTFGDALARYCAVRAPEAKVSPMPFWLLSLIATMTGNKFMKFGISVMRYFDEVPEAGDPSETYALLGKPETTIEQFAEALRR